MEYTRSSEEGVRVNAHLLSKGIETPFSPRKISKNNLKILFTGVMEEVGLDLSDDSLMDTPTRLAKLYSSEFFSGLDYNNFPKTTVVESKFHYNEMIMERNIQVYSLCEHHFLPIIGGATVAYIPNKKVMGLSKLNRIVDFFCRRPQIQERLTVQIVETLKFLLETDDVAVLIDAEHTCVKLRGVMDPCSDTVTSMLSGAFKNPTTRAEFMTLYSAGNK